MRPASRPEAARTINPWRLANIGQAPVFGEEERVEAVVNVAQTHQNIQADRFVTIARLCGGARSNDQVPKRRGILCVGEHRRSSVERMGGVIRYPSDAYTKDSA